MRLSAVQKQARLPLGSFQFGYSINGECFVSRLVELIVIDWIKFRLTSMEIIKAECLFRNFIL